MDLEINTIEKAHVTGMRYIAVLEAEVVRVPVLKFGVLQVLLCETFILQTQSL